MPFCNLGPPESLIQQLLGPDRRKMQHLPGRAAAQSHSSALTVGHGWDYLHSVARGDISFCHVPKSPLVFSTSLYLLGLCTPQTVETHRFPTLLAAACLLLSVRMTSLGVQPSPIIQQVPAHPIGQTKKHCSHSACCISCSGMLSMWEGAELCDTSWP